MFQAMGVHGPTLSPFASLVLDAALLGVAFWLLAKPTKRPVMDTLFLAALVLSVSLIRVVMQPLPNIQPVTVAALLVGAQLGARRGAAFAVLVAMISNFFMGDGWWTIFQALGWASVAVVGANANLVLNGVYNFRRTCIAAIGTAFIFDFIVSLSIIDGTFGVVEFMLYLLNGIPFDVLHAVGNIAFAVWFGAWFASILEEQPTGETLDRTVMEGYGIDA